VSALLMLTSALRPSAEVLPALALLPHTVRVMPAEGTALLEAPPVDLVLVDGRQDLVTARDLTRLLRTTGTASPVLLILTEGGLSVAAADWGFDDFVLATAGPAEVESRIRLAIARLAQQQAGDDPEAHVIRSGEVTVDDVTYTAKLGGQPLDLTAQAPRPAPRAGLHPGAAAPGGVGLRLLRRHPHRRRPRAAAPREARPRARAADRDRPQRRLPLRAAADGAAGARAHYRLPMTVTRLDHASFDWASGAGGAAEVRRIADSAHHHDGRESLNEAAVLTLRNRGLETGMVFLSGDEGFAYVHGLSGGGRPELDLVVEPSARGRGVGTALARAALEAVDGIPVTAWSHGNHPAAAALARRLGFEAVRELWLMRRPRPTSSEPAPPATDPDDIARSPVATSSEPAPPATGSDDVPEGFAIRPFEPGADDEAFLAVNAAAFADHPEQGSLDQRGLDERKAEEWFDPAGFLVASRDGSLVGFHWTKVHPDGIGEVYVIGVHPSTQGSGIGRALLAAGLERLSGTPEVVLYVEAANTGAIRLYESHGFTHAPKDTDVLYATAGS
jgi:mycothiol synthase